MSEERTVAHLTRLLDERDERIAELETQVDTLNGRLDRTNWAWAIPRRVEARPSLPIPRLEIELLDVSEYEWVWEYRLVYEHFVDGQIVVPFGKTTGRGSVGPLRSADKPIELPLRDGAHILHDAEEMRLPAFIIHGERVDRLPYADGNTHAIERGRAHRTAP